MGNRLNYIPMCMASCVLLLGGCTGGGGGGMLASSSVIAPVSQPAPPVPAPAPPLPTVMVSANFQPGNTTLTYPVTAAVSGAGSSGLSAATPGEGLTAITVPTANGTFGSLAISFPRVDGQIITSAVNLTYADPTFSQLVSMLQQVYGKIPDDSEGLVLTQSAGTQQLNSSAFGLWSTAYETDSAGNGAGRSYVFAFGNLTPSASVPTTGSATFNGVTTGMGGDGSGANALSALQGNVQVIANFSAQSVTSKFSNLTIRNIYTNSTGTLPDLTGTSTISGNAYSGSISGTGLIGTVNGHFYGPTAQETAGVWQASGSGTWMGSYGAK